MIFWWNTCQEELNLVRVSYTYNGISNTIVLFSWSSAAALQKILCSRFLNGYRTKSYIRLDRYQISTIEVMRHILSYDWLCSEQAKIYFPKGRFMYSTDMSWTPYRVHTYKICTINSSTSSSPSPCRGWRSELWVLWRWDRCERVPRSQTKMAYSVSDEATKWVFYLKGLAPMPSIHHGADFWQATLTQQGCEVRSIPVNLVGMIFIWLLLSDSNETWILQAWSCH